MYNLVREFIMTNNTEKIYKLLEHETITNEDKLDLKELLVTYKDGSIGIAQINPIVGDIEYNAKKNCKIHKISTGYRA